ncbi:hypothetical protein [Anaerovorax sp. IOR16]|uniref:hypothetical protein n=1 Tax=Anaerovorax sp. IOR16 TaxID=2773458 RepID=UPI0019CFE63F|nr:hypothetical protein [Anaerovorax sp. IOR16]
MALTQCPVKTTIIGELATEADQRGLTEQEFKDKFDEFGKTFVEWFNQVHLKDVENIPCNPNLLNNAYFELKDAIVNQKGTPSGWKASTSMYFIDRWKSYINITLNTTYTFETNGLGIQVSDGYGGIAQLLEFAPNEGMYTFSAIIDGIVHSLTFDANTWNAQIGTNIELAVLTYYDKKTVRILFYDTVKHIIQRVKLEKGTVSTILNDPPQDFGDTLRKCQRFQYRLTSKGTAFPCIGFSTEQNAYLFAFGLPTELRINPTVTWSNVTVRTSSAILTPTDVTFYTMVGNIVNIKVSVASANIGDVGILRIPVDGFINLDANL